MVYVLQNTVRGFGLGRGMPVDRGPPGRHVHVDGSWAQNWSDPAQWSTTSSGTPGPGDTVQFFCAYYPFNDCVNLDANRTVANVIVSTSNDPYALNILGSTTLTVTGSFTFNAVTGNGLLQTDNAPPTPSPWPTAERGSFPASCPARAR